MAKQPTPEPVPSWEICLRVFCFLWAIVGLYQLYPRLYFAAFGVPRFLAVLTTLAGVLLLLRPQSLIRFFLFAAAMVAIDTLKLRIINNHELTIIGIHCAVCIYLLVPKVPGFKLRFAERHEFYRFLISSLRMTVIVIYFWTLVHKLNSGFVNTEISCAAMQLFNLQNKTLVGIKLTFIPTGDWARILAIYSTLVIGGAIPVLLLFKKTRVDGVFLGFFLHLILGFPRAMVAVRLRIAPSGFGDRATGKLGQGAAVSRIRCDCGCGCLPGLRPGAKRTHRVADSCSS